MSSSGHMWHPFADMSAVRGSEVTLVRGEGCWVEDADGRRYLDATAALWYCAVGHGRERLAEAAREQMTRLAAYQTFDVFSNLPAAELATRVCELAGWSDGGAAFFTSGGSDGVETAMKMARRYWSLLGEPQRTVVLAREGAYHGMHLYGTSLSGIEANAAGWGPLIPDVVHLPRHDLAAVEAALQEHRGRVAAFIGEPVQGAGGVHPPQPGYWSGVQDLCRAEEILLIADEVVTGFGRLGDWFGFHRYEIEPDLIITAKGLSSGYVPIGAVIAAPRLVEAMWAEGAGVFRHGYTYSGHPASAAVALENLRIIEEEGLAERVRELEGVLGSTVGALGGGDGIAGVRVAGLLAGVVLEDPGSAAAVSKEARSRGVLTRPLADGALQISPPFVITEEELRTVADTLAASVAAVSA
ncbi:MAG: aspartate aminotransferase family protein [Solirubrobacterales bacterium]